MAKEKKEWSKKDKERHDICCVNNKLSMMRQKNYCVSGQKHKRIGWMCGLWIVGKKINKK